MKHFSVLLTTAFMAGFCLQACRNLAPPAPTITPTLTNPTTVPSPTPAVSSYIGTSVSFDQLSLVVPTGVAAGGSGMLVPEAKGEDVAPWDVAPEHIQLKLDGVLWQRTANAPKSRARGLQP